MKTNHFFKAAILLIAATLAGCSNDNIADEMTTPQEETQGMTEFAVAENPVETTGEPSNAPGPRRTSGEYTGSAIKFYWTSGDKLWINDGSVLKASKRSNIPAANGKELTAKFWFDGNYTAPNYPVRYTGNSNTQGDKVTIKAAQAQQTPNDGSHIGDDGDCGTATATRGADGKYNFTLAHKASYLTFMPYYSSNLDPTFAPGFASSVKLTQIKVTTDQPLAGTFDFNDAGIQTYTVTAASNSITLTLNGGGTNGFEIPTAIDYSKNAAIMVVNPGSYTNFTVEYTLHDQATNVTGTVTKNYGSIACYAGKNKKIAADLAVPNYSNTKWSMWDALQTYWQGHEGTQPRINFETGTNYPQSAGDPRWYSTSSAAATNLCASCPNINEMFWYISDGDAHWDATRIWCAWGHLYQGGMWFLKKAYIFVFNSDKWWDGKDYRVENNNTVYLDMSHRIRTSTIADANLYKYFYLPALENMDEGNWAPVGLNGIYWTSTPQNGTTAWAYSLLFSKDIMQVIARRRMEGDVIWAFE